MFLQLYVTIQIFFFQIFFRKIFKTKVLTAQDNLFLEGLEQAYIENSIAFWSHLTCNNLTLEAKHA